LECCVFIWNRWSRTRILIWLESAASLIGPITLEMKLMVKARYDELSFGLAINGINWIKYLKSCIILIAYLLFSIAPHLW
jgi:hypothetical protein